MNHINITTKDLRLLGDIRALDFREKKEQLKNAIREAMRE